MGGKYTFKILKISDLGTSDHDLVSFILCKKNMASISNRATFPKLKAIVNITDQEHKFKKVGSFNKN